jgi:hypothetical protein
VHVVSVAEDADEEVFASCVTVDDAGDDDLDQNVSSVRRISNGSKRGLSYRWDC